MKYKDNDKFVRTSKEIDQNRHTQEHIKRWSFIGEEGKFFYEINSPNSEYRNTLSNEVGYRGNDSEIHHHLTYDITRVKMIKKVNQDTDLVFGHITGIKEGEIFESREELSLSGIHTPPMNGIWGREKEGACSIVLSGGYEDDVDELDYILYTGQGGQDSPGGKQVSDQEFIRGNKGLVLSKEYNLPVRVTRGYQVQNGPEKGYRYDGLFFVKDYERIKGKGGYYICRFHLESEKSVQEIEENIQDTLPRDYSPAKRKETITTKVQRSVRLREKIKDIYDYKCQVCGIFLEKPGGMGIAIGAHIQGLGKPHNGPDTLENMLCLCPNHHDQFDAYSFYIEPENLEIVGLKNFEGKKLTVDSKHKLDKVFLEYHKNRFMNLK